METIGKSATLVACTIVLALGGCAGTGDITKRFSSASTSAEEQRAQKEAALPQCTKVIGSVTIVEPEKNWWLAYQLQSPNALIKMFVAKSGCFTILDRGRGFAVAERERVLASGGTLQSGSNIGGGQVKAADYVITPDVVVNNSNAGGNAIGAILGSFIPGIGGIVASQLTLSDKSAEVTLAVTDVRTSEQVVLANGTATKTDIGFGFDGGIIGGSLSGIDFGAAGASSYANTAIGQVVAMAYLDAYGKMIDRIKALQPAATPKAEPVQERVAAVLSLPPPPPQPQPPVVKKASPIAMAKLGHLFHGPSVKSGPIRELPPGSILYPTKKKSGTWWEVTDDTGKTGWVSSRMLQLGSK